MPSPPSKRKAKERLNRTEQGLKRVEHWIPNTPEDVAELKACAERLRSEFLQQNSIVPEENEMTSTLIKHAIVSKHEGVLGFAMLKKGTRSVKGCISRTTDGAAVNCKNYTASTAKKYFTQENEAYLATFSVGTDDIVNVNYENYSEEGV